MREEHSDIFSITRERESNPDEKKTSGLKENWSTEERRSRREIGERGGIDAKIAAVGEEEEAIGSRKGLLCP